MALIVGPPVTANWTLTRERICDKALEKCGRAGVVRASNPSDRMLCLEALDGLLKNLLWFGYSWPKTTSGSSPLVLTNNLASIALPTDYYTGGRLNYVDASGNEVPLPLPITAEEWRLIPLKTTQAAYPIKVYIDNFNVLFPYPRTNQSVTLNLYYQKVIDNTVAASSVNLDSPWLLGLVYGVAADIGDEFGVKDTKLARFEAKWREQRNLGIMNEGPPGPDRISVSD
jgi:hypothetical protein